MNYKTMKIPEGLHRRLKMAAVERGMTMIGYLEEVLDGRVTAPASPKPPPKEKPPESRSIEETEKEKPWKGPEAVKDVVEKKVSADPEFDETWKRLQKGSYGQAKGKKARKK